MVCYLGDDSCGSCLYDNAGSSHSAGALWCVIWEINLVGLVYTAMRVPLTARVRCGVLFRR